MIWPVSCPLPATSTAGDLDRAGSSGKHFRTDLVRVLAARIIVGNDYDVGEARCDSSHFRPLALIAIAARTEDGDEPLIDMRP